MKKLALMAALLCAGLVCAEEAKVQKIVPVKNGDPGQLFQTVRDLFGGTIGIKLYQNNIVLNGPPDGVAAAEQLVHNLDAVAPQEHDIDITGYIILASAQSEAEAKLPAELDPVLKQFRNLLTYKSFRVLDTIVLRAKENSAARSDGFLPLPNTPGPGASASFTIRRAIVNGDVVHLTDLKLFVNVPTPMQHAAASNGVTPLVSGAAYVPREVVLGTDVDVKTGQKVAIGKASVDAAGDALILVISAKVVD